MTGQDEPTENAGARTRRAGVQSDTWMKRLGDGAARVGRDTGLVLLGVGAYAADGLKELRRLPELMQGTSKWTADAADRMSSQIVKAYRRTTDRGASAYESMVESRGSDEREASAQLARTDTEPSYQNWTKGELYERAQELDIEGRSGMNKSELIAAIRDH